MYGLGSIRILHGCHTTAEPTPPEKKITVEISRLIRRLANVRFTGIFGMVKHSAMPQDLTATGTTFPPDDFNLWLEEARKGGFNLVTALECNIHRTETSGAFVDGDPAGYDWVIYSAHCTMQCGWNAQTPQDFLIAYEQVLRDRQEHSGSLPVSLGHMFMYAQGGNWTESYLQALELTAKNGVVAGIFMPNTLRMSDEWTRAMLYHPTDGLTVLQPWAKPFITGSRYLRLTLDSDAHQEGDVAWITPENVDLLVSILRDEGIYRNFTVD